MLPIRNALAPLLASVLVTGLAAVTPASARAGSSYVYQGEWVTSSEQYSPAEVVAAADGSVYTFTNDRLGPTQVRRHTAAGEQVAAWNVEHTVRGAEADAAGNLHLLVHRDASQGATIDVYTPAGQLLRSYATEAVPGIDYFSPSSIAAQPDGSMLVVLPIDDVVVRFAPDGSYAGTLGGPGTAPGQFEAPQDVASAADGTFYVTDRDNERVHRFAPDGTVTTFGSNGLGDGQFMSVLEVAVGPDGHVFVSDNQSRRIQEFTADGTFVGRVPDDALKVNSAVEVAADGTLYVGGYLASLVRGVARFSRGTTSTPGVPATSPVRKVARRAKVVAGKAVLKVSCTTRCAGKVRLVKGRKVLAAGRYSVAAGRTRAVKVPLTRKGRAQVRKSRKTKAVVRLTVRGDRPVRAKVTLRR